MVGLVAILSVGLTSGMSVAHVQLYRNHILLCGKKCVIDSRRVVRWEDIL